jgi:hypothetical protein
MFFKRNLKFQHKYLILYLVYNLQINLVVDGLGTGYGVSELVGVPVEDIIQI